jgi:hypothetical protein
MCSVVCEWCGNVLVEMLCSMEAESEWTRDKLLVLLNCSSTHVQVSRLWRDNWKTAIARLRCGKRAVIH